MKYILRALLVVLCAAPVAAQVPVYTNADLGKPLARRTTISPEQLASLAARQFVYVAPLPAGPTVTIIPYTPTAPMVVPPPSWAMPWVHRAYLGWGNAGFASRGFVPHARQPGVVGSRPVDPSRPVHHRRAR